MGAGTFVNDRASLPRSATRRRSADVPLLLAVVALLVFGLVMLYSASFDFSFKEYGTATYMFNRQVRWLGLGILLAFALSFFDYHRWRKMVLLAMLGVIALLVTVLIVNEIRLGASRTLLNGSYQPSELAKLVTVIYLSVWLYAKRQFLHDVTIGLIPLGVILGIIGGLIYLQPDLSAVGTVLILGGLLFFLAGADMRQIVLLLILAVVMAWIVVQFSETGQDRVDKFIAGLQDPTNASYHVRRSFEAIIKGGVFGVGVGQADTKLTGLPFAPTDSIFAVVVEELGLFGAFILMCLYGALVWRGLVIARRAPDMLGTLLASGMAFWIGIEALINMSVMVGLMPFAGNALPLVSAGGSNLVSTLCAIGVMLNISRQSGDHSRLEEGEWRSFGAVVDLRRRNGRRSVSRARRSQRGNG
ncbi:MAG: FtsW/RodA/SpoVE family cell cycle protein [Anaerolineales bacterium]|nr:FtsW/RodA/SpoVE family cell cycle protein [Anaerolineales bacterium]NUQ84698.1 FtsW/RodA/SpoVE family cell cycle protein [Anaerolineales bacterium]